MFTTKMNCVLVYIFVMFGLVIGFRDMFLEKDDNLKYLTSAKQIPIIGVCSVCIAIFVFYGYAIFTNFFE